MDKFFDRISSNIAEIIYFMIFMIFTISFFPPIAFKYGAEGLGQGIHSVYRIFCHQRVERTAFLLGEDPRLFYSVAQLQQYEAIPAKSVTPDLFGKQVYAYPYFGNSYVGFKSALCVRDTALYAGMLLAGAVYLLKARKGGVKKLSAAMILILMAPMVIDVAIQISVQAMDVPFDPTPYVSNIPKRILTGLFFGIGFAHFVFPQLKEQA